MCSIKATLHVTSLKVNVSTIQGKVFSKHKFKAIKKMILRLVGAILSF